VENSAWRAFAGRPPTLRQRAGPSDYRQRQGRNAGSASGRHGELPASAVVWRAARAAPTRTSGTGHGLLFMVNEGGIRLLFSNRRWRHEVLAASGLAANTPPPCSTATADLLFQPGGKKRCPEGRARVESLATASNWPTGSWLRPRAGRALFLRTKTDLYRIRERAPDSSPIPPLWFFPDPRAGLGRFVGRLHQLAKARISGQTHATAATTRTVATPPENDRKTGPK